MLPDRNILKTAKTILKIQDKLHPLLFGEDGFMLEETRQELLKKANFYIAKVLRTIQDIQVSDIILVGSSASYFYTSASDFDLKIILNLSHNRAIGSNVKKFLKILNNTFYRNNVRLRLYDHFIDIKFDEDDNFVMGNYSVLHNRWNIKPRCDFDLTGVQPALLIQNFYKKQPRHTVLLRNFLLKTAVSGRQSFKKSLKILPIIFKPMLMSEPMSTAVWLIFCHLSSSARRIFCGNLLILKDKPITTVFR